MWRLTSKTPTIAKVECKQNQTFWGCGVTAPDQDMVSAISENNPLIWECFAALSGGFIPHRLLNFLKIPFWYPSTKGFSACTNLYEIHYISNGDKNICKIEVYVDAKNIEIEIKYHKDAESTKKIFNRIDLHL